MTVAWFHQQQAASHLAPDTGWMRDAACRELDPNLFHSPHPTDIAKALATCRACPVRVECADYAHATQPSHDTHGVWGGLTAHQRRNRSRRQLHQLIAANTEIAALDIHATKGD